MANTIRQDVIKSLVEAGSGHSAGPLGMADVFTALYFKVLNFNPKDSKWPDRDRFILSNGHIAPVWYATMANAGLIPKKELMTLRKFRTRLQGHPHRGSLPWVENTSGPLGTGLSEAVGFALAAKLNNQKHTIYAFMSDAEQQEGNTWEAVMLAAKYKLDNLTALVDYNNIQIDGKVENVMPLEPFRQKYEAFNWHVLEVNGHNIEEIINVFEEAKAYQQRPVLIIANTIPGKGVSFMENNYLWHGKPPSKEEAERALKELEEGRKQLEAAKYES